MSETLTEKRDRLIKELEAKLSLLKDDGALLRLEEQEKKLLAELEQVRSNIDNYRDALGLSPRSPAGTKMAAPAASTKPKKGSTGPRGPRTNAGELLAKLVETLKAAGQKGMSVTELSDKSGFKYQTVNNFRRKNPTFAEMVESVEDGRSIILSLKAKFVHAPLPDLETVNEAAKKN